MREPIRIDALVVPVVEKIAPTDSRTPPAGPKNICAASASGAWLVASPGSVLMATQWMEIYRTTTRHTEDTITAGNVRRG